MKDMGIGSVERLEGFLVPRQAGVCGCLDMEAV